MNNVYVINDEYCYHSNNLALEIAIACKAFSSL
jgi:hypothetical protein